MSRETFEQWLAREMPAGTVISDPAWWAPRILKAALASRDGGAAAPIASVTGYHGGHCVIEPLDRAVLLPVGMALYSGAQAAVPDMMEMEPFQTVDKSSKNYKAGWNACRAAMLHHKERTE